MFVGLQNYSRLLTDPLWAPLTWTFAGLWEIQPQAQEDQQAPVQIVDVREPEDFDGPLGHIRGALLPDQPGYDTAGPGR